MAAPMRLYRGLRLALKPADSTAKTIKRIATYSVAVDPPNQAAAGVFSVDVAVTGLVRGTDFVLGIYPPSALEANLKPVGATVNSDGNIRLVLQALAAVDGLSLTWIFVVATGA